MDVVPAQRRESRLQNDVGKQNIVLGMNFIGFLCFLFVLAYFMFDLFFLFLQIALRHRLSIVADVEDEEFVSSWRDVVRIRVLASDLSFFVQRISRDPVRVGVLAEQGFEILLMLG